MDDLAETSKNPDTKESYKALNEPTTPQYIRSTTKVALKPKEHDSTQTDPDAYINFACNMFYKEIQKVISEETNADEDSKFTELLNKV